MLYAVYDEKSFNKVPSALEEDEVYAVLYSYYSEGESFEFLTKEYVDVRDYVNSHLDSCKQEYDNIRVYVQSV